MSRKEYNSKRRASVFSLETLDDRLLLNAGAGAPATPPPAPSPVSLASVRRFERGVERIDHDLMAHSKNLESSFIRESDRLKATLASLANRPQVRAQLATSTVSATTPAGVASQTQPVSNELDRVVASFNVHFNQLNNGFEQQFGVLATPLEQADDRFGIPASAFENNLLRARAGISAGVAKSVSSVAAISLNQTTTVSKPASASTTTTATTSTAATSTTTVGVTATQVFTNADTQAFSSLNAAINSVDSTLQKVFGAFQTQFQTNVTSLITSISTTPLGAFQPTVSFVSGNGTTFTGTG